MSKIFAVCLAFNRPEVVEGAIKNFQETWAPLPEGDEVKTILVDPGYPVGDLVANRKAVVELALRNQWDWFGIENQGVLPNWNRVIHEILIPTYGMANGDFLITWDPDVRMSTPGWLPAMIEVLRSDNRLAFVSSGLGFHGDDWLQKPPYNRVVHQLASGTRYAKWGCLIAWASGIWKADPLITRPRNFGARGKYYGWNEHADYERLLKLGMTWASMVDYIDNHLPAPDISYQTWKQSYAAGKTPLCFEDWLRSQT